MKPSMRRPRPAASNILAGIVRVACGRAQGLRQFGANRQSFLASLAPLVAFPLVGAVLMLMQGDGWRALAELLATLSALIAPAVLSYEPSRLWKRQDDWLHFATALNWCQWAIPVLAALLLMSVYPVLASQLSASAAGAATVGALCCYGLWLHWFVARHALRISVQRAVALVLIVNVGTAALVAGPALLAAVLAPMLRRMTG